MSAVRFYLHPTADSIYEEYYVPYWDYDCKFYYRQMLAAQSESYNFGQWPYFGGELDPNSFAKVISGDTYIHSASITQENDLYTSLQPPNGTGRIPPGIWTVKAYLINDAAIPDTTFTITYYVYRRRDSTESLLFTWSTDPFVNIPGGFRTSQSPTQEAFTLLSGDKLVLKAYCMWGESGDNLKFRYGLAGANPYHSYIELPEETQGGKLELVNGWKIGEVTINDNAFTAELRSRAQFLQQNIVNLYSPQCRADLGDADCGIDLDDSAGTYRHDGAVTSVSEDRYEFTDTSVPSYAAGDVFTGGKITWSTPQSADIYTGNNAGFSMEVKKYDPSTQKFELFHPMPYDIEVDDEFTVTWGCDKAIATCKNRFDNIVNFRGEPYVPNYDAIKRGRM